jgi:hypothetical protein
MAKKYFAAKVFRSITMMSDVKFLKENWLGKVSLVDSEKQATAFETEAEVREKANKYCKKMSREFIGVKTRIEIFETDVS